MPLALSSISNRERMDLFAPGPDNANRLFIYTGIAVLNPNDVMWVINENVVQESIEIILGSSAHPHPTQGDNFNGSPNEFVSGTATVALAGVSNQIGSDQFEWSLRGAQVDLFVQSNTPLVKLAKIVVPFVVQGNFTAVLRVSYTAFVAARATQPNPRGQAPPPQKGLQGP